MIGIAAKSRFEAVNYATQHSIASWVYCQTGLESVSDVVLARSWVQNPEAAAIHRNIISTGKRFTLA